MRHTTKIRAMMASLKNMIPSHYSVRYSQKFVRDLPTCGGTRGERAEHILGHRSTGEERAGTGKHGSTSKRVILELEQTTIGEASLVDNEKDERTESASPRHLIFEWNCVDFVTQISLSRTISATADTTVVPSTRTIVYCVPYGTMVPLYEIMI